MTSSLSMEGHSPAQHAGELALRAVQARLTRKEKELLAILVQNPGRCISRETLLRTVWNYAEGARTRTVDVHIQRLRRKLGQEAAAIKTIVRLGYCWYPDPEALSRPAPI